MTAYDGRHMPSWQPACCGEGCPSATLEARPVQPARISAVGADYSAGLAHCSSRDPVKGTVFRVARMLIIAARRAGALLRQRYAKARMTRVI